jgi:hypothetical protein
MTKDSEKKQSHITEALLFYFSPDLRTFLSVLYLVFFAYFTLFFIDNISLALKFIWYTLTISRVSLSLGHVFWGALFIISLIIPFSVSFYAVFLPVKIFKRPWTTYLKFLAVIGTIVASVGVIIFMDQAIRFIETREPITIFLEKAHVNPRLP